MTSHNTLDSLRSCPEKMAFEAETKGHFVESLSQEETGQLRKSMLNDAAGSSRPLMGFVICFHPHYGVITS